MSKKQYDAAVIIGRFQVPHRGHIQLFNEASKIADKIIILVGSTGQPRTPKNPFSFEERKNMIEDVFPDDIKFQILPIRDQRYNLQHWIVDVVNKVNSTFTGWTDFPPSVALVGHHKDDSSYYLDMFPQWDFKEVENVNATSSTIIRGSLFENLPIELIPDLESITRAELSNWRGSNTFLSLKEEYKFIKQYKAAWHSSPYPPTFVTVDAVVVQSGHLLMVRRRAAPGKGLYALPGGFLGQDETIRHAVVRELVEETKIKLQPIIIDRSIKEIKVYDSPDRSQRGRTITHAALIELTGSELPRVKGADDADKAKWIPLNEVYTMGEQIYEDHLDIILNITGNR